MTVQPARALALAALLSLGAGAAQAQYACGGSYAATLLHPLPFPTVVALEIYDNSPENVRLGAKFTDGLRQAGVTVDGTPNARLRLTMNILGPNGPSLGSSRQTEYQDWKAMGGGVDQQLPDTPNQGIIPRRGSRNGPGASTLMLRAEITDPDTRPVAWVATLQCAIGSQSNDQLAYDLGVLIGGAIGKTVARKTF